MRFEGEEVKSVALGAGWVAAVTSLNFLRIFTEGGLQVFISLCLFLMFLLFCQYYSCGVSQVPLSESRPPPVSSQTPMNSVCSVPCARAF